MSFNAKADEKLIQKFKNEKEQLDQNITTSKSKKINSEVAEKQTINIKLPVQGKNKIKKSYISLYLPEEDKKKLKRLAREQGYAKVSHFVQDLIEQLPD
ncbi:ribbon-helix-helix domain-containing protein [Lactobacillus gallinarum]|uniref:ribbon-helix-helix domain-containing protein n=1 Tax=Lactobacillus gallinarum TaxID=52242 RepID=UPI0024BA1658|nr:ribbon-helix-helix domain-containing protein [Lactobacillus gallinarum]